MTTSVATPQQQQRRSRRGRRQARESLYVLTDRWSPLRYHAEQARLWNSRARFRVVHAGRRSGKTELAKRYLVKCALACERPHGWFVYAAPTFAQAKRIYWHDAKALVPRRLMAGKPNESELTIRLRNGADITVLGLDRPERLEGRDLDGIDIDEYGNMKKSVWHEHVRPALSTPGRPGWAWLFGVPEGRNHYYDLAEYAKGPDPEWDCFWWHSADILDAKEMEAVRREMDERTLRQEYGGEFVDFAGRAYYPFTRELHATENLSGYYDPRDDLILCFDFNVSPGVAAVCQERFYTGDNPDVEKSKPITMVIGEVWIERGSNTPMVCRRLVEDWKEHKGRVLCYGDATGGAKGTAKVQGSDIDLIPAELRPHFQPGPVYMRFPKANPAVRSRINAVNTRLLTADGKVKLLVDPAKAPHVVKDLEGVTVKEGSAGELDKDGSLELTHISDGLGYYLAKDFPVRTPGVVQVTSL